jgi:transcriptional regulator with XRE-family HTH domain
MAKKSQYYSATQMRERSGDAKIAFAGLELNYLTSYAHRRDKDQMEGINNIARNNIKIYRKMRKMTQKELAEALDVTHSSVSAWEIGKNSIDLERLNEICQVLNISLAELLSEDLSAEAAEQNEENKQLVEYINKRPEVKKLLDVTGDSRSSDIMVAVKVLEALKRR